MSGENEIERWLDRPLDEGEQALAGATDWGPSEDWSDWADAAS